MTRSEHKAERDAQILTDAVVAGKRVHIVAGSREQAERTYEATVQLLRAGALDRLKEHLSVDTYPDDGEWL